MSSLVDQVVQAARGWVGRSFNPGVPAQCAYFVREVFKEAGITLPVVANPDDGMSTGEGYADGLAGDEVGPRVEKAQLQPGDIVLFFNTYGDFPPSTITHVGVYVGDGQMVDRPTASEPVKERSIDLFTFGEGRRPSVFGAQAARQIKVFAHDGKMQVAVDGQLQPARAITVNGKAVQTVEIIVEY